MSAVGVKVPDALPPGERRTERPRGRRSKRSTSRDLAELRALIHAELGIQMPADKVPMLTTRLQKRMRILGLTDPHAYQEHLVGLPSMAEELRELAGVVTTNKTDFFREPEHFRYLTERALADQGIGSGRQTTAKVWCAGCSSGEEAYTLAMALSEHGQTVPGWDFGILATDISPKVLEQARTAVYGADRITPLPAEWQARYLRKARDPARAEYRVCPELRARVAFRELNFMSPSYDVQGPFDVIFFRNVAIYFDAPTQRAVVDKLRRRLKVGGHLFMGQSESLVSGAHGLERVGPSIYRHVRTS